MIAEEGKAGRKTGERWSAILVPSPAASDNYREVLREMCGYGVLRSILVGAAVTLRNVAFESLFGLKWG